MGWYRGAEYRVVDRHQAWPRNALDLVVPPDSRDAPPIEVPTVVRSKLPSSRGETIITYTLLSNGIAVWVYDDRGVSSRRITIKPAELEARALQFHRLCSTRDSDLAVLRSAGSSLYDLLVKPIEDRLAPERTLVFETEGVLSEVPMEALVDHQGRYFGDGHRTVFAAGFYQTLRLHSPATITRQAPVLIVSVPVVPDRRAVPLMDAEGEAQTVASCFRSVRRLDGLAASLAAIRNDLRGAVVFHFVGHAAALPELNGLLLADYDNRAKHARLIDGESFSAETVKGLKLVVLAACDTGAAADGTAGTEGLVQALLRDGVPDVVASRWRVDSAQTASLMRGFYRELLAGKSVAASLHAAKMELVMQPSSSHPYYWAAFELQGL